MFPDKKDWWNIWTLFYCYKWQQNNSFQQWKYVQNILFSFYTQFSSLIHSLSNHFETKNVIFYHLTFKGCFQKQIQPKQNCLKSCINFIVMSDSINNVTNTHTNMLSFDSAAQYCSAPKCGFITQWIMSPRETNWTCCQKLIF